MSFVFYIEFSNGTKTPDSYKLWGDVMPKIKLNHRHMVKSDTHPYVVNFSLYKVTWNLSIKTHGEPDKLKTKNFNSLADATQELIKIEGVIDPEQTCTLKSNYSLLIDTKTNFYHFKTISELDVAANPHQK